MNISPSELYDEMQSDKRLLLLDVRMPAEYREKHIEGSVLAPLDQFDVDETKAMIGEYDGCVIYCLSGKRAIKAAERLRKRGCENIRVLDGGIRAWEEAGKTVVDDGMPAHGISIMRQVQIIVATGIVTGLILALTVNLWYLAIPIFFGLGVTFAGLTGKCGMAWVLAKMPWNRAAAERCESPTSCKIKKP